MDSAESGERVVATVEVMASVLDRRKLYCCDQLQLETLLVLNFSTEGAALPDA